MGKYALLTLDMSKSKNPDRDALAMANKNGLVLARNWMVSPLFYSGTLWSAFGKNTPKSVLTGTFVVKPTAKGLPKEIAFKSKRGYENRFLVPKDFWGENLVLVAEQGFDGARPTIIPEASKVRRNATYYHVKKEDLSTAFNPVKRGAYAVDEVHFLPVRHSPGKEIGDLWCMSREVDGDTLNAWANLLNGTYGFRQNEKITFKDSTSAAERIGTVAENGQVRFETDDGRRFYLDVNVKENSLQLYKADSDANPLAYINRRNGPFVGFIRRRNSPRVMWYYPEFDICGFDVLRFGDSAGRLGAVTVGKKDFERLGNTMRFIDKQLLEPVMVKVGGLVALTSHYRLPQRTVFFRVMESMIKNSFSGSTQELLELLPDVSKLVESLNPKFMENLMKSETQWDIGPSGKSMRKFYAQVQKPGANAPEAVAMNPKDFFVALESVSAKKQPASEGNASPGQ